HEIQSQGLADWQIPSTSLCGGSVGNRNRHTECRAFGCTGPRPKPVLQFAFGAAGSESSNAEPAPSLERTAIPPPRSTASRFEMYRPSPAPPYRRVSPVLNWVNGWKSRG